MAWARHWRSPSLLGKSMRPNSSCRSWSRDWLKEHDIEAVIPYKTNEKGRRKKFNRKGYRRRNIIERCVSSLKWFRRVATRYEKLAIHYLGMVTLAIIFRLL